MAGISITSGTFQITSDLAPFNFPDVSKSIMIQGAGPGGGTLLSSITEVFHSGSASIADSAFVTVVDSPSMFGSNFQPVIQGMLELAASTTESAAARTVVLPAGSFLIDTNSATASLKIQDGVTLHGQGPGLTELVSFGVTGNPIIKNSESINREFFVKDLTLNGAKDFHTQSLGSTGMVLDGASEFGINNVTFVSSSGDALCVSSSFDGTFRNIKTRENAKDAIAVTGSDRLVFEDINDSGSAGYGINLKAVQSSSITDAQLDLAGSGSFNEQAGSGANSFVNLNDARFRTNDFAVFGTSIFANPADQLEEYFVGTVPFKSKGQAHAFQTVSGSRSWLQFPLFVNNEITGSDLIANSYPGMAWVMDYRSGSKAGTDDQLLRLMSPGIAGPDATKATPDINFGWTTFYSCTQLSGSHFFSGSAFQIEAPVTISLISGSELIGGIASESFTILAQDDGDAIAAGPSWLEFRNYDPDLSPDGSRVRNGAWLLNDVGHLEYRATQSIDPATSGTHDMAGLAETWPLFMSMSQQGRAFFSGSDFEVKQSVTASEFSGTHEPFTSTMRFYDGESIETIDTQIISNGTSVSCSIAKVGGGDIRFFFTGSLHTVDTTPPVQVDLTPGTDTVPQLNYIFVTGSAGPLVLTSNISGWPEGPHAAIATAVVQSAASVQTDGPYKLHVWTNHLQFEEENGHQAHVSRKLRITADWDSGVALASSGSISEAETWLSTTAGKVFQLHNLDVRALDMAAGDQIYVLNDPTTTYLRITGLSELTQDAAGVPLANNKYYNFVIWASVGEDDTNTQFFLNLPDGNYTNEASAQEDSAATAIFTIPTDFRGTGFLIARITLQYSTTGVPFNESFITDLRGLSPSTAPGGGASVTDHGALSGLLDDDHAQYLLTSGTRPLAGEWNAGAAITSSFTGTFEGTVASSSRVYHELADDGPQSASFTMSWVNTNFRRIEPGASIGIDFSGLTPGQIVVLEIDNAGGHEVTLPGSSSALLWDGGVTGSISTGLNLITLTELSVGTFASIAGTEIS